MTFFENSQYLKSGEQIGYITTEVIFGNAQHLIMDSKDHDGFEMFHGYLRKSTNKHYNMYNLYNNSHEITRVMPSKIHEATKTFHPKDVKDTFVHFLNETGKSMK